METKGRMLCVTVAILAGCFSLALGSHPLQEVGDAVEETRYTPKDAVEWLAQDWYRWALRDNEDVDQYSPLETQDQSSGINETEGHPLNSAAPEQNIETQLKDKATKAITPGDQMEKKATGKTGNRRGRMMMTREGEVVNEEGEEDEEGRFLFGTTGNEQITISMQGLMASIIYLILGIILFKFLIALFSGRDLSYWGNMANNWYSNRFAPNYYHDDYSSSYSAYRRLQEAADKYE